jgi:NHL repeat-containing protein
MICDHDKFELSGGARFGRVFAIVAALALSGCARQPSQAAAPAQLPPLVFAGAWGTRGSQPGQLDAPAGIATDEIGHVFIVDAGKGTIEKFTAAGGPLLSFGDSGLAKATGIAVDRGGGIYVAELQSVQIFWPEGDRLRVTRSGLAGAAGVAADTDGNYYVTDGATCRVVAYDDRGRMLRTWGSRGTSDGQFEDPSGVTVGPDGFVYVADSGGARVQKFSRDGTWTASIGQADANTAAHREDGAIGVAVSGHNIFLAGGEAGALKIWTLDGEEVPVDPAVLAAAKAAALGGAASDTAALQIAGVNIDAAGDLLLLDTASNRVLRFHVHL